MSSITRLATLCATLAAIAPSQITAGAVNVLLPSANNLSPADQEILISPDGTYVAVKGSLSLGGDVAIVEMDTTGQPANVLNLGFPNSNDIHATNSALVMSRRGSFLCCYGSLTATGDLVFISRNAGGTWFAQNVVFPASNNAPSVGTAPAISFDEQFIVCRGSSATAELVIVPVDWSSGHPLPGNPFNVVIPGGNTIPLQAITPVVAPNSLSFAVPGNNSQVGDLVVGTVGRPVDAMHVSITNVLFPGGNNVLSTTVPVAVSPTSTFYAVHGSPTVGDVVIVTLDAAGFPVADTNILWPATNNTSSTSVPPVISGNGRLLAVNGGNSTGDLALLPLSAAGYPGTPVNVNFPAGNFWPNAQLPPVVSNDAYLVLQLGSSTIGDVVITTVTFPSPTTISTASYNVLFPANNNVPDVNAHLALAPDRSFFVTNGSANIGDLVVTALDSLGIAQTSWNVLYPQSNNVANLGTTPRISHDGLSILTSGSAAIGDAVITRLQLNASTGLVEPRSVTNVLYPASNDNAPAGREPQFSPTTQFVVSAGSSTVGDLVFVPLRIVTTHFLAPADIGRPVRTRFQSPADGGRFFAAGASFGRFPGLALSAGRTIPLNADLLLTYSLDPLNPVFVSFAGTLDGNGIADATTNVPPDPSIHGAWIYLAFVVADPLAPDGIGTIADPAVLVIE